MKNKKNARGRFWARQLVLAFSVVCIIGVGSYVWLNEYTRHGKHYRLPDLCGLTLEEAQQKSHGLGLRFQIFDSLYSPLQRKGAILEQYPKPGSVVKKDRKVILTVNTYEPRKAEIPFVAGYSLRQAKNRLRAAGMEIGELRYVEDIATNNVIEQYYRDTLLSKDRLPTVYVGSPVDLVVGVNPSDELPSVPRLVGIPFAAARDILWENGFNLGQVLYGPDVDYRNRSEAVVIGQGSAIYATAPYGTPVDVRIAADSVLIARGKADYDRRVKEVDDLRLLLERSRDTIRWIREGNTVRYKIGDAIFEYAPSDTTAVYERAAAASRMLDSLAGAPETI